ncbi:hypothetical protein M8494_08340 [Serratia ureilytica]
MLQQQRELLTVAADAGDEGTASLMSDYIKRAGKTGLDAQRLSGQISGAITKQSLTGLFSLYHSQDTANSSARRC